MDVSANTKEQSGRNLLSSLVLAVAVAEPLMTVPQIYQIWSTHNAAGVSLATWAGYIGAACIWLAYSMKIKDKPLMVSSALWVVTEALVVAGALLY